MKNLHTFFLRNENIFTSALFNFNTKIGLLQSHFRAKATLNTSPELSLGIFHCGKLTSLPTHNSNERLFFDVVLIHYIVPNKLKSALLCAGVKIKCDFATETLLLLDHLVALNEAVKRTYNPLEMNEYDCKKNKTKKNQKNKRTQEKFRNRNSNTINAKVEARNL